MLETLGKEFEAELRRCDWEMTDELVAAAVSVYLKARVRKLEALEAETANERKKRLEKKREESRRYRENGTLRDVGAEVFGQIDILSTRPMPTPPPASTPKPMPDDLDGRRELIEKMAERRRKFG